MCYSTIRVPTSFHTYDGLEKSRHHVFPYQAAEQSEHRSEHALQRSVNLFAAVLRNQVIETAQDRVVTSPDADFPEQRMCDFGLQNRAAEKRSETVGAETSRQPVTDALTGFVSRMSDGSRCAVLGRGIRDEAANEVLSTLRVGSHQIRRGRRVTTAIICAPDDRDGSFQSLTAQLAAGNRRAVAVRSVAYYRDSSVPICTRRRNHFFLYEMKALNKGSVVIGA